MLSYLSETTNKMCFADAVMKKLEHKHHVKLNMDYSGQSEDMEKTQKVKLLGRIHHDVDHGKAQATPQAKSVSRKVNKEVGQDPGQL